MQHAKSVKAGTPCNGGGFTAMFAAVIPCAKAGSEAAVGAWLQAIRATAKK